MNNFCTYITSFFKPEIITIPLKVDKEVAASKIEALIRKKASPFFADIGGKFISRDKFQFWLISFTFSRGRINSKLYGEIRSEENANAFIDARLKPSPGLYIFLCIGIVYLVKCIIEVFSKPDFIGGFLFSLLLVPALFAIPFFIYHVSNASTIEKFKSFLKKDGLM